jgi:hypothetical protein
MAAAAAAAVAAAVRSMQTKHHFSGLQLLLAEASNKLSEIFRIQSNTAVLLCVLQQCT